MAEPLLERNFHPTVIVSGYGRALQCALETCKRISRIIDVNNVSEMRDIVMSAIGTKFSSRWGDQMVEMAINAVQKVVVKRGDYTEVDIKRYVRIEKIPGGELSDCTVLDGVMFNKDITHSKMRRRIENPRILLLDCPLEYPWVCPKKCILGFPVLVEKSSSIFTTFPVDSSSPEIQSSDLCG